MVFVVLLFDCVILFWFAELTVMFAYRDQSSSYLLGLKTCMSGQNRERT